MNILKTLLLFIVVVIALPAAAEAPVAVRVEVESLSAGPDGTDVVLTVQVSPEDRSRIGKNAMVRVMLDGDVPPGQSPLWAVRVEGDGSGRIETVWPPGEHSLRVEISSPNGEHTGLWVGTVRIPGAETAVADANVEPPAPKTMPTPEPESEDAAAAAAAVPAIAAAPAATPAVEEPVEASDPVEEDPPVQPAPDTVEIPESDEDVERLPEPEVVVEQEGTAEVTDSAAVPDEASVDDEDESMAGEHGAEAAAAVAGTAGTTAAPEAASTAEPPPDSETSTGDPQPRGPETEIAEPDVAIVEPLRADAPQSDDEPGPVAVPAPEPVDAAPEPPPAEIAAAFEAWSDADPATADLTVIAFRDDEPATGLLPSDFSLRVGGEDAMIEKVGDRDRAPLQLGIVVDVAAGAGVGWSQSGGRLFPLVQRARAGRGHVFFAADGRVGGWDDGPGDPRGATGFASSGELTSLIVESLARFEGRRGRTFLVVVTDGRIEADKAVWKTTEAAAENAGVPVLVIALWDENFSQRVRKNLKAITKASGGGLFLVQGSAQLDRAAERFGPMIDAGVAIRFVIPPGVVLPAQVSVQAADKALEVTAPKGVR